MWFKFPRGLSDQYLEQKRAAESWKTAAREGRSVLRLTQQRIRTREFPMEYPQIGSRYLVER